MVEVGVPSASFSKAKLIAKPEVLEEDVVVSVSSVVPPFPPVTPSRGLPVPPPPQEARKRANILSSRKRELKRANRIIFPRTDCFILLGKAPE
jgi:hypothetical protein